MPDERASHPASDIATRAFSRLGIVGLRRCAAEPAHVSAMDHRNVVCELHPTLLHGPRQDLARAELLHAGRAIRRLHRHPLRLRPGAEQKVLLYATFTEHVPARIERKPE